MVVQASLNPEGTVEVLVELAHLEPGEKSLVQTTVTQEGGAIAEATALVTGAAPAGPQRATLTAAPRTGTFVADKPLVAFTQATNLWTTALAAVAAGHADKPLWVAGDDGWDGAEG